MIRKLVLLFVLSVSFAGYTRLYGQDTVPDYQISGGKWRVCVSMQYSDTFQCTQGYTNYEFTADGRCKENQPGVLDGKKVAYKMGDWELSGNTLIIDPDDGKTYTFFPHTYEIIWLDADRFYSVGTEGPGGPTVYTYFQRSK